MFKSLHQKATDLMSRLTKSMNYLGSLVLLLMMFLTMTDVVLRKLFNQAILGTVELSSFMLVIVIFFTLADTEMNNGHVKVDLFVRKWSRRSQGGVDMATQLISTIVSGMITWSMLRYSLRMKTSREVSQDLWIPIYPFVYLAAFGCAVLTLALLIKFIHAIREVKHS
jgi:TRAP-type transport system small permease protein